MSEQSPQGSISPLESAIATPPGAPQQIVAAIEVKSAAFLQSWHQKQPCSVFFNVKKTRAWDPETNVLSAEAKRQADVYVFALLKHTDKSTLDPLDVQQWGFFVLPATILNERKRSQHSITLKSLRQLCGNAVTFDQLAKAVVNCRNRYCERVRRSRSGSDESGAAGDAGVAG